MYRVAAIALAGSLLLANTVAAQESTARRPENRSSPLLTTHARVAASLDRIAKGSSLWRDEVDVLRGTGRQTFILTSEQVVVVDSGKTASPQAFDRTVLAEVSPVVTGRDEIDSVLVVVNLALLDGIHSRRGSLPAERDADLDLILIHEVYGHAFPYLRAGSAAGRCPDPAPGQRPVDACSIVRENAVRVELGLGRRRDYGLNGLLLSLEPDSGFPGLALALRRPR
jgi:hypothetical protein